MGEIYETQEPEQPTRPKSNWKARTVGIILAATTIASAADAYNFNDAPIFFGKSLRDIRYAGTLAAKDTPKDFLEYRLETTKNDERQAELYLVNLRTGERMQVHEDGRVGTFVDFQKDIVDRISDEVNIFHKEISDEYDDIKENETVQEGASSMKRWYKNAKQKLIDFLED